MTDTWNVLWTGLGAPSWNMALDEALLEHASSISRPVLRLYGWNQPAATFGYFQKYSEVVSWTLLRPVIRRPTGGGLVPHDADWTYSLIFPPEHPWSKLRAEESYRRAHDWISDSFRALEIPAQLSDCCDKPAPGRCFVGAEKFDVLAGGRKIAGAAQKRNKFGLLIQGSIQPPGQSTNSTAARNQWENALLRSATLRLGIAWDEMNAPEKIIARAAHLDSEKYSTEVYTQRR